MNNSEKTVLKKYAEIETTSEFESLLNKSVSTYKKPCNLVKLSLDNSIIVKNVINEDDRYRFLFSKIVFDSCCKFNDETKEMEFKRDKDSYIAVLKMIDIDNSTLVYRFHKNDFYNIINFIMNDEDKFYARLKDDDITLVDDLTNVCSKNLISFCSKVCKFLNQRIFNHDGYYIYDYYVSTIAYHYLDYYKIFKPEKYASLDIKKSFLNDKNYQHFHFILSKIHEFRDNEFKDQISKHDLDQIMWYCYRSFSKTN